MSNAIKRCTRCGKDKDEAEFGADKSRADGLFPWCRSCRSDVGAERRAKFGPVPQTDKTRAARRDYTRRIRDEVLAHYGRICACCGSAEDLSIDHVNGDGIEHREAVWGDRRISSYHFYLWLRANDFPEGFQILCRTCNHSKGRTRRCWILHDGPAGFKLCRDPQHQGVNPLPFEDFYRSKTGRDGREPICKGCYKRSRRR
jgi:hypothetical protein